MKWTIAPIQLVFTATAIVTATPASADSYRMIDREKPTEFMLVQCVQTPRNPTLNWISGNCTPIEPQQAANGPIIDVLYSAAGSPGDVDF